MKDGDLLIKQTFQKYSILYYIVTVLAIVTGCVVACLEAKYQRY